MDFRDLRYFETVADTGHLGRAAAKVFRSQPALTKSIQRLEADLGADLFERSGRMLKLTPVGQVLLERARFLRRAMVDATREVSDVAKGVAGHVRVGTAATAAEFLLPQVTASLLKTTPGVTMEVVIGMNDVLRASLREGHLDLVIGPVTGTDPELEMHAIARDEVVVAARKGHPVLRKAARLEDLCAYSWVLPARTVATRAWLDRLFESHKLGGVAAARIETFIEHLRSGRAVLSQRWGRCQPFGKSRCRSRSQNESADPDRKCRRERRSR